MGWWGEPLQNTHMPSLTSGLLTSGTVTRPPKKNPQVPILPHSTLYLYSPLPLPPARRSLLCCPAHCPLAVYSINLSPFSASVNSFTTSWPLASTWLVRFTGVRLSYPENGTQISKLKTKYPRHRLLSTKEDWGETRREIAQSLELTLSKVLPCPLLGSQDEQGIMNVPFGNLATENSIWGEPPRAEKNSARPGCVWGTLQGYQTDSPLPSLPAK